jgi:hypothetical protein
MREVTGYGVCGIEDGMEDRGRAGKGRIGTREGKEQSGSTRTRRDHSEMGYELLEQREKR